MLPNARGTEDLIECLVHEAKESVASADVPFVWWRREPRPESIAIAIVCPSSLR